MTDAMSTISRIRARRRKSEVAEIKLKRKLHPVFEKTIGEVE